MILKPNKAHRNAKILEEIFMVTKKSINNLCYKILGCAIEVHKHLGPGLLESIYHQCLKREFELSKISYISQFRIPIEYKGYEIEADYKLDFLVEENVIVELKTVDFLHPVHEAQLLTYMKLMQKPKGLLINFNSKNIIEEGSKQMVNEYFRYLDD